MKIGILTFHCADNYGAVLQAYALQEHLNNLGHEVRIIDYRPQYLIKPFRVFSWHRISSKSILDFIKGTLHEFVLVPRRLKRHLAFRKFTRHRLKLSKTNVSPNKIPEDFDIYIVGSDQIWNIRNLSNGKFDDVYFCKFDFPKQNKRYVAYAASMQICELTAPVKQYLQNSLKNFDAISVREVNVKNLLNSISTLDIEQVLDPTLLVQSIFWDKLAKNPFPNKDYILVYQVSNVKNTIDFADKIAKSMNAELIVIGAWVNNDMREYQTLSPEKFIGAIKNAKLVITTSFHGTAFSIIFKKDFYTIRFNNKMDNRSESLLHNLSLDDRIISIDNFKYDFNSIDWNVVTDKLGKQRVYSESFLVKALNN